MSTDVYQDRYLGHQQRKAAVLAEILAERHSERRFAPGPVAAAVLERLTDVVAQCPSSCDRKAVTAQLVIDRDRLALLGGTLVGGVGWVHRAPAVMLLHADPAAYKAGDEVGWMPYLDAGVVAGAVLLTLTSLGMAGCYVNPNIRQINREHFARMFGEGVFCGAIAFGAPYAPPEWAQEVS